MWQLGAKNVLLWLDHTLMQGCSTQISWQPKKIQAIPKSPNDKLWPIQRVHLSRKQAKNTKLWAYRAKLNASAGHIWPAGRMLCMPALKLHLFNFELKRLTWSCDKLTSVSKTLHFFTLLIWTVHVRSPLTLFFWSSGSQPFSARVHPGN